MVVSAASLQQMLDKETGNLAKSMNNVSSITGNLASNNDKITHMMTNLDQTTGKLAQLDLQRLSPRWIPPCRTERYDLEDE